ncbi:MAG: carboxylating nicotinate-nucleotide diphosphorylase [Bacteroidetes bacterium]|nr:MAG: carboxylating nicotinate-nucleotide diphosphorylase [Bacteroidota bacterium]
MTIDEIIEKALEEDIGDGDHTSLSTIPGNTIGKANLIAKEDGVIAGCNIAKKVFNKIDPETSVNIFKDDGTRIKTGDIILSVEGKQHSLLTAERLALNFMQRMSGIASFTNLVVKKLDGLETKVLDTRKTTPLLRELEKYSVRMGGGHNHRMGLFDMIMIKDNHIDFAGGIEQAIDSVHKYLKGNNNQARAELKIEIEVRDFIELDKVLAHGGVHRIMLDNFTPVELKKAIGIINKRYETEASGGISIETIRDYAKTGVDFISVGALTHQIKSLDMSLIAAE